MTKMNLGIQAQVGSMRLIQGDALTVLKTMPDESVHCCVTSPPYWGLRDYGVAGQLGLEKSPEEYVEKMVVVFREVRRVLRNDGVFFLNLGDSYARDAAKGQHKPGDSGKQAYIYDRGGGRASACLNISARESICGTSYKEPEDYRDDDCLLKGLCDECQVVLIERKLHTCSLRVDGSADGGNDPSQERKGSRYLSLESLGSIRRLLNELSNPAMRGPRHFGGHESEHLPEAPVSTLAGSSLRPPGECFRCANCGAALSTSRSSFLCAQVSAHMSDESSKKPGCKMGNALPSEGRPHHNQCTSSNCLLRVSLGKPPYIYPERTTLKQISQELKPKDLVGIPWRVAFALQADGWWLRSDIIWAKPNPMPESVTDRPTKAHEYVFLLSKSPRYYFDQEAVKEPYQYGRDHHRNMDIPPDSHVPGTPIHSGLRRSGNKFRKIGDQRGRPDSHIGGSIPWEENGGGRNLRSVWTINTEPFPEAHFATFPQRLVEPCIKAGCPRGGVVLDPFMGSGTTGVVCVKLERDFIGIDLNPDYYRMSERRIYNTAPLFMEAL